MSIIVKVVRAVRYACGLMSGLLLVQRSAWCVPIFVLGLGICVFEAHYQVIYDPYGR